MPRYLEPMKATLATQGVPRRGLAVRAQVGRLPGRGGRARRQGRSCSPATATTPRRTSRGCSTPPTWIEAREAIVDGEVVALDERGHPDFSLLQERISEGRTGRPVPLVYQAFDLLYLDGRSLRRRPARVAQAAARARDPAQRRASSTRKPIDTEGVAFFEAVKAQGLEGIVAKHRRSRYEPGRRASSWLKIKARPEQELVVGGWTPGEGSAKELGAVVVGVYEDEQAAVRGQGRAPGSTPGRGRSCGALLDALETDAPAVRPAARAGLPGPVGRRPRRRPLDPARSS